MDTHNPHENDEPTPTGSDEQPTPDELTFGPTDSQLAKELKDYAKALREEFAREEETATSGLVEPVSNAEKYTRQFFRQNLPDAAAQIVWLSCNSDSDSVRLNSSHLGISYAVFCLKKKKRNSLSTSRIHPSECYKRS